MTERNKKESPRREGRGGSQKPDWGIGDADSKNSDSDEGVVQAKSEEFLHHSSFNDPDFAKTITRLHEQGLFRVIGVRVDFGLDVVLVPVQCGGKNPIVEGYPHFTSEKMLDSEYLKWLERSNIGILTGQNSGNLISVDLDTDEVAERFFDLNDKLCRKTIRSKGEKGCNYWFRIRGEYPNGVKEYQDAGGNPIGELRAGRGITMIDGKHPEGMDYAREGKAVVECLFSSIKFPEDWLLPWVEDQADDLVEQEGLPYSIGKAGGITINEPYFVEKFAREHLVLHDPGLGFYEYESSRGVWLNKTGENVMDQFSRDIKSASDDSGEKGLLTRRSATLFRSLTTQLAGRVEEKDAFLERPDGVIHASNGMLHVTADSIEIQEFDPRYRSLAQIPLNYDPDAKCPGFINKLLRHALPENDILLLQKYAGQILLGKNLSHTLLILEGIGGAGKGQIGTVIDLIAGRRNVAELRTAHLSGRFEMKSFVGKNLLAGRDVPGDFLNQKGASALKKLTGGDLMTIESKGKDDRSEIVGEFNVIVTANTRLIIALEGDKSAWKRRLLLIPFEREPAVKPIVKFGEKLVEEEGEGILAWMVEGAQLLLRDMDERGRILLDGIQRERVLGLLAESDSVMAFVTRRVCLDTNSNVRTRDLYDSYMNFCDDNGFVSLQQKMFERRLPSEMLEAHGAKASENIHTGGTRSRGYIGVRVLGSSEEDIKS